MAPKKKRTGLIVGISLGVVALLGLTAGGVFALNTFLKGGGGTAYESASAVPATSYLWVEIAIDPSPAQKLAALEMINKLPGLTDALDDEGLDLDNLDEGSDLPQRFWEMLEDSGELDDVDIDYEKDIKPWLGDRIAYALLPGGTSDEPAFAFAIEATDTAAAQKTLEELVEEGDGDEEPQFTVRGNFVVMLSESVDLDEAYEDGTLAEQDSFIAATDKFGDWGLVASWLSPKALATELNSILEQSFDEQGFFDEATWREEYGSAAAQWEAATAGFSEVCKGNDNFLFDVYAEDVDALPWLTGRCWDRFDVADFETNLGFAPDEWESAAQEKADHFTELFEAQDAAVEQIPNGSLVSMARFADSSLEFTGTTVGMEIPTFEAANETSAIAGLPASTVAALSYAQLGSVIDTALSVEFLEAYPQLLMIPALFSTLDNGMLGAAGVSLPDVDSTDIESFVDEARSQAETFFDDELDMTFPDDLRLLFGSEFVIAADEDLDCGESGCDEPRVGALIVSDDADETADLLERLIDKLIAALSGGRPVDLDLGTETDDDRVALSLGDYREDLLDSKKVLGDDAAFRKALPKVDGSLAAFYLDFASLIELLGDAGADDDGEIADALEGLAAIGFSSSQNSDGDLSYVFRITAD